MKLKIIEVNGKSYAEVQDEKPVYVYDDGKEVAFDAAGTVATISRIQAEAKRHREAKETAETALKTFEGITDAASAKHALEVMKNLDDKKLVDSGEVEKVRAEAIKAVEDKYGPVIQERDALKADLINEKIGGSFARSKFITDALDIPVDMVQARFGNQFKLENGKVIAYDSNSNPIYSRTKPGEVADFDEALNIIVDNYPQRDSILKSSGARGGGSSGAGPVGGQKTYSRDDLNKMDPAKRAEVISAVRNQTATITDN